MTDLQKLVIRTLKEDEIQQCVEWAAREGWNPGIHDAATFYAADPEGFAMAELEGRPVGFCSAVRYGKEFAFMGFFIVDPEYRGAGVGLQLSLELLNRLEGVLAGLDGVVAQQENYKRSGFVMAHRNIRYQGRSPRPLDIADPALIEAADVDFDSLAAYDRRYFPADRKAFLKAWIGQPESRALAYISNGEIQGYGVIRMCRQGFKIGPLFAESPDIAESLFLGLADYAGDDVFFLDIPEPNASAGRLVAKYSMEMVFETARMYRNGDPRLDLDRIYGITSFELG